MLYHLTTAVLYLGIVSASASKIQGCASFPASLSPFLSDFKEPQPPIVHTEFSANFVQHKWNANLSHITSGWLSFSERHRLVQALEAYDPGVLASSTFDYSNLDGEGQVKNILTEYGSNSTRPTIFDGYVNSVFPMFTSDILVVSSAVFSGLVKKPFFNDKVAAWDILYQGKIPTTVFATDCGVVVGYDFFSPILRT